ncbi:MAG: CAAD domain-containing protein [Microcoleaceae cyanobacterium]|jgi:glutamyl-tRNA synthetase
MTQANSSGETELKTPTSTVNVILDEPGAIASVSTSETSETEETSETAGGDQIQQIKDQILSVLSELPAYASSFFGEYQKPIVTVGLIVGTLITIKVTLAVLEALNDIPLLSPTFELIGMGYTGWFIYRYLLRASNRQELVAELESFKEQIFGRKA